MRGWDTTPASSPGIDALVVSTAIPEGNVERVAARESGIPEMSRAEALAAVMTGSRGVAVAGTHGKTTTTSMLTVALQHCGADPSFAIGSELNESGSNAHLGTGDVFVVEADESDGAFLFLEPVAGIVTNVEADHLDHWGTFEAIEQGFLDFATGIRDRDGFLVVCVDDRGGARLAQRAAEAGVDVRTYGEAVEADYRLSDARLTDAGWAFDTVHNGVRLGEIALKVPGRHNALERPGRLRHRPGARLSRHRPARGPGVVQRHAASIRLQGAGRRHPRLRRLCPPSDGDRGDAAGRARRRGVAAG